MGGGRDGFARALEEAAADEAEFARQTMLEELYSYSDEMAEKALAEEPISNELIRKVLREATLQRMIQPVVCGSALHGMGVQGPSKLSKYAHAIDRRTSRRSPKTPGNFNS